MNRSSFWSLLLAAGFLSKCATEPAQDPADLVLRNGKIVTVDEAAPGAEKLAITTRLNGEVVQSGDSSDMIFSIPQQIALLSEAMTLEPGDIIMTGTPPGVGVSRKPPLWMKPGDRVEVEIDGLGCLSNTIEAER